METNNQIFTILTERLADKRKDNFKSHLKTFFSNDCDLWYGEVDSNEFNVWSLSKAIGIFYPVIKGKKENNNGKIIIVLTTRLNILGKIIYCLLQVSLLMILILFNLSRTGGYYGGSVLMQILICCSLFILTNVFSYIAYREVKKGKILYLREGLLMTDC